MRGQGIIDAERSTRQDWPMDTSGERVRPKKWQPRPASPPSLPSADAPAAAYLELARWLTSAEPPLTTAALRSLHGAAKRRQAEHPLPEDVKDALNHLESVLRLSLGAARVARREGEVKRQQRREPFRSKVLEHLNTTPASPTDLATSLGTALETISRVLTALSDRGLVTHDVDPHDARRRIYRLTEAGYALLNDEGAFGTQHGVPDRVDATVLAQYLGEVIDLAVSERRQHNRLEDAARRLEVVAREAQRIGELATEVRARNELATTLRQSDRWDEVDQQIEELDRVATGARSGCTPLVALQACAHHEYELGRLPQHRRHESITHRSRRLLTAASIYERLEASAPAYERWLERQAWATVSNADLSREVTDIEGALRDATLAETLFSELEDPYGLTRSLFLQGFCLRLTGEFELAWEKLHRARDLADRKSYHRFHADTLTQLGEVCRCQRRHDDARALLHQAITLAGELKLTIVRAYAESALGATEHDVGHFELAKEHLTAAQVLFDNSLHAEGRTLNFRRLAVVSRHAWMSAREGDPRRTLDAFKQAAAYYAQQSTNSPAGRAACHIGAARFDILLGDDSGKREQCGHLLQLVQNADDCRLLNKDPWIPTMLRAFAMRAADDRLEEEIRCHLPSVDSDDRDATSFSAENDVDPNEMASEPRRRLDAAA